MEEKELLYQQVIRVWEAFCQAHQDLYELACEEYLALLESNIERIEEIIPQKENYIAEIAKLEKSRSDLIESINLKLQLITPITKAYELIDSFVDIEKSRGIKALGNLNDLLIDTIKKLQDQNRKNQVFLNKAMMSLGEMKEQFSGKKTYKTYGADGFTKSLSR